MTPSAQQIVWTPLFEGQLSIGHRPKKKAFFDLRRLGTTHVLTLLSESEGALDIGAAARQADLRWLWLPLDSASPPTAEGHAELLQLFNELREALAERGRIHIHCSAGIHRTGMIAHAFLRWAGFGMDDAFDILARMRQETAAGVGDERLRWGDQFARVQSAALK